MTYINIFFTVNNNYIPYLATAIASIIANINDNSFARFYIISNDIVDINKKKIDKLKIIKDFYIEYIEVDNKEIVDKVPEHSSNKVSIETNYRLMIADIKRNIDKAIFLDADLVVNADITELWNVDIEGYYAAVVKDAIVGDDKDWWYKKLPLEKDFKYINTGVLLINLKKWREDEIFNKFMEVSVKYNDLLKFPDQDIINIALCGHCKYLDGGWNYTPSLYYADTDYKNESEKNAKIYHYPINKPWSPIYSLSYEETKSDYREYFWKYAHMTPFYEDIIYINVLEQVDKKINTIIESLINEKNTLQLKLNEINTKIIDLQYEHYKLRSKIKYNNNWIKLFGIYNTKDYLIFYLFGFKITLKMNEKNINKLAWWIPIRKWRDNFRSKFFDNFIGGGNNE